MAARGAVGVKITPPSFWNRHHDVSQDVWPRNSHSASVRHCPWSLFRPAIVSTPHVMTSPVRMQATCQRRKATPLLTCREALGIAIQVLCLHLVPRHCLVSKQRLPLPLRTAGLFKPAVRIVSKTLTQTVFAARHRTSIKAYSL